MKIQASVTSSQYKITGLPNLIQKLELERDILLMLRQDVQALSKNVWMKADFACSIALIPVSFPFEWVSGPNGILSLY